MKLIDAPKAFSSDDQCLADLEASHWPDGVCYPTCRAKDRLEQFEASLKKGREVLQETTDDRLLNTKWRMLAAGKLMSEQPRYVAIRDGVLNHMAHHRGQLTVYLRLNDEKVPAIYRPSGLMKASDDDTTPGGVGLYRPFLGATQSRWPGSACDCYEAGTIAPWKVVHTNSVTSSDLSFALAKAAWPDDFERREFYSACARFAAEYGEWANPPCSRLGKVIPREEAKVQREIDKQDAKDRASGYR